MNRVAVFSVLFYGLLFFMSCSGCSDGKNKVYSDSISIADSDVFPDADQKENKSDTETQENDFADSNLTDHDPELPDHDNDSFKDTFTLKNECFGKKVLTKEIVEVDKYGDGFENEVNSDFMYQIDRYYDKNCRIKFEVKYKINTDDIEGIWDGSHSPSYEYDDKGNVKKICTRDKEGAFQGCSEYSYEFNSDGKVIKMCKGITTEGRDVGCVYYSYNESGKLKQRIRNTGSVMGHLEFYRNYSEIGAEFFSDDYSIGKTTYDRQERIDYFYDEKGRLKNKDRYFLYEEYDENDYVISRRGYNVVNRMIGKFAIDYNYNSSKLPVKSSHHEIYQEDFKDFYTAEYERDYSYDEKMRPTKITTNCVSCGAGWKSWLDEWEYYPDGTLKRHRASLDKGGGYEERTYDEKGREIKYKEVDYTGDYIKTEDKTYYENTDNIKTNHVCYMGECRNRDYTYEFSSSGEKTSETWLYTDENLLGKGRITLYRYNFSKQILETKEYSLLKTEEDTEFVRSQYLRAWYFYDEKGFFIAGKAETNWDETSIPTLDEIPIYKRRQYDSSGRLTYEIKDNQYHIISYHGETTARDKVWLKNGIINYEYDEKGNLISEDYKDPGGNLNSDNYTFKFKYDTLNNLISAVKGAHDSSRKENHKYFYTTFEGEPK